MLIVLKANFWLVFNISHSWAASGRVILWHRHFFRAVQFPIGLIPHNRNALIVQVLMVWGYWGLSMMQLCSWLSSYQVPSTVGITNSVSPNQRPRNDSWTLMAQPGQKSTWGKCHHVLEAVLGPIIYYLMIYFLIRPFEISSVNTALRCIY